VPMTRAYLESFRDASIDDLVGPGLRLLFVGINPGLWTAATGAHFARPGNRFYPALAAAGITEYRIDASGGMTEEDRRHLIQRGVGITNLVRRATARADELTAEEFRDGAEALAERVAEWQPRVVAVAGIGAYRTGFGCPRAVVGRQPEELGGAELWVVPNPSGLNAHSGLDALASAYGDAARAAGIVT
jgi:TDG/mug DNA glycosylase family protein